MEDELTVGKVTLSFDVGTKNLAYCLIRDEDEKILDWNVVDISAPTYDKQCQKMIEAFDKIDYTRGYPKERKKSVIVVIERQPCRNPKMRIISGQIQMYYALEKSACLGSDENILIEKVIYYSPKFKLRCYKVKEGDTPIVDKKYSTPYAFRKNLAIQHCGIIINRAKDNQQIQDEKWVTFFDNNKKKRDDLSDSYLQGLAYIRGVG